MIRIEGLRVRAGEFALAIDDLSVVRGEYLMVLGPTASGKTVLLETIAGLRCPQQGHVWLAERDVTEEAPERRGVGLVYQDYALFPHLTVARNIGFGLRTCGRTGDHAALVHELADLLHIDGLLDRYPEGLSGGEQQRVALARALAIQPEVLLLDEPLSALDGPTRSELQGELKRLHEELGTTVVHVTHDLDEALALGDRMAVLIGGGLRQVGAPGHVTRRPIDVEVARLVGLTNLLAVAGVEWERGDPAGSDRLDGAPETARTRVRLWNGGHLTAEGTPPAGPPDRLRVVIPAEEISLVSGEGATDGGDASVNVLNGIVRAVRIQSVHAAVEVEVPPVGLGCDMISLTVNVLRPEVARRGLAVGARVRLHVPPSAVHLCAVSPEPRGES